MNIGRVDLNLLVYLDTLLQETSVTRAALQLGITQPAMSNGLKRLRTLFKDPLLVRTAEGMIPTERAKSLQPIVRKVLADIEQVVVPETQFIAKDSQRMFRIMVSDYAFATLLPNLVAKIRRLAPKVVLDFMTPSDVTYVDLEQGRVDLAINRFEVLPQSFHQRRVWQDDFSVLCHPQHPLAAGMTNKQYLNADHIWVSKTGMGVGLGVHPEKDKSVQLGWVDEFLANSGYKRRISLFARQYQVGSLIQANPDLLATLPTKIAVLQAHQSGLILQAPPLLIPPIELTMAWSPLLHQNPAHQWLRHLLIESVHEGDQIE